MLKAALHIILLVVLVKSSTAQQAPKMPNIILILADDLGWADLSCYGSTFYETPNLDKLATQGIRFTNAYAASPVCSPTRASILTGKYPIKTGITDWIVGRQYNGKATAYEKLIAQPFNNSIQPKEETIAEVALKANYKTFIAGKWHLGEDEKNWPEANGFQINKGGIGKGSPPGFKNDSTGGFFTPYNNPRLTDGPKGEYLTDRLTNESISFIEENKNSPFFLMYSLYAVHNPLQAPANLIKKFSTKKLSLNIPDSLRFSKDEPWMKYEKSWKQRLVQDNPVYAAMIKNMDDNIGRIISKIDALGLSENTIIVFTSDNGGLSTAEGSPTSNGVLKAGKGWLYEGGIRVPFILKWPSKIKENQVSDIPISSVDVFPTFLKAINNKIAINKEIDGVNIMKILANKKKSKGRTIFWHYPHYSNQGGKPGAAMIRNNFKIIFNYEDSSIALYNLKSDLDEQHNLALIKKTIALKYKQTLNSWLEKNKAKFPLPNPIYDPTFNKELNIKIAE